MSWLNVQPYPGLRKETRRSAPVTVAVARGPGGSPRLFLAVTVRPDAMAEAPPWWRVGQDVEAAVGDGEDAGRLRIACNGPHRLSRQGGHANAPTVLRLPLPAGIEEIARQPERAVYEVASGALVLTLPSAWFSDRQQAA